MRQDLTKCSTRCKSTLLFLGHRHPGQDDGGGGGGGGSTWTDPCAFTHPWEAGQARLGRTWRWMYGADLARERSGPFRSAIASSPARTNCSPLQCSAVLARIWDTGSGSDCGLVRRCRILVVTNPQGRKRKEDNGAELSWLVQESYAAPCLRSSSKLSVCPIVFRSSPFARRIHSLLISRRTSFSRSVMPFSWALVSSTIPNS